MISWPPFPLSDYGIAMHSLSHSPFSDTPESQEWSQEWSQLTASPSFTRLFLYFDCAKKMAPSCPNHHQWCCYKHPWRPKSCRTGKLAARGGQIRKAAPRPVPAFWGLSLGSLAIRLFLWNPFGFPGEPAGLPSWKNVCEWPYSERENVWEWKNGAGACAW